MEYEVISANNPEAVARRLNERQGWYVIAITCETSYQIPCYSAFIGRVKPLLGQQTSGLGCRPVGAGPLIVDEDRK